jgi:predicted ATPase
VACDGREVHAALLPGAPLLNPVEIILSSPGAALPLLEDAWARVERTGGRWFAAEILRLEAEALLTCGQERTAEAVACFARALETAIGQQARFWELRAALSLARLNRQDATARERMARICAEFDDVSALPELEAARALAGSRIASAKAAAGS